MTDLEFEKILKNEFNKIWSYCNSDSNKEWTLGVKTILSKINEIYFRGKVATSNLKNSESGEWLLDFISYEENHTTDYLSKIIMSAEIEWRNFLEYFPQIKYDFEKLLVIKSEYKLFIFEVEDYDELITYSTKLQELLNNYNLFNSYSFHELYYLIIWNKTKQIFEIIKIK